MKPVPFNGKILAPPKQRRSERRLRLSSEASVRQGTESGIAQLLNISRNGLLLQTEFVLRDSEALIVTIPGIDPRRAEVAWSSGHLAGCRFEKPLRRVDLANSTIRKDGPSQRELEPIGPRIKRLREECGLSMVGLANRLGVSKPTLWKWESGKMMPSRPHFRALCYSLKVTEVELAYGSQDLMASLSDPRPLERRPTLAEAIARSREFIAEATGIDEEFIEISIRS